MSDAFLDVVRIQEQTCLGDIRLFATLPSTNDYALAASFEASQLPLLIVAQEQTQGRGRGSNRWWAGEGALTFSLLIQPDLPIAVWPLVSLTIGTALCDALVDFVPAASDVRVKWPNDVYIEQRKVSGILTEAPKVPNRLVVGIGINVNNRISQAPPDVRQRLTSLSDLSGTDRDRTEVLIRILNSIDSNLRTLRESPSTIIRNCRARCYLSGRPITVDDGFRQSFGTCTGIDDDGALRLETEAGPVRFVSGVVTILD